MADFNISFEKMIINEGGYKLHQAGSDRGGQTYAGISRNFHPNWPGWRYIDNKEPNSKELSQLVMNFYKEKFWVHIKGDEIKQQSIADSIFDFAVNAGVFTASKLAQIVVNDKLDGVIGPKTLEKLNQKNEETFIFKYALAKISRYAEICNSDRSQRKFLLGWINRTISGLV